MKHLLCVAVMALALLAVGFVSSRAVAQDNARPIEDSAITALQAELDEAGQAKSSARKKLALRRVIREGETLLEKNPTAPNRFEVLGVLFRSQQQLLGVDDSTANRGAFLETCRQLAAAPNEYAAIRLDADLLLSQAELAKQGADLQARGEALRPLVERYQDTEVEARVIRIAMLMALEFGDTRLIGHLREVIAERHAGDLEMIRFLREKLAGQVFGAPFVGRFESSDGKQYRLPMDGMGKTTGLYFWSKEGDGLEQLKLLAEGWKQAQANPEYDAASRYQFISFNVDGLPDAGESLLREAGLDWPALHLPDGEANPVFTTYVQNTPKLLTTTPTGYAAMVMSGSTRVRPDTGWERSFQSRFARSWARPDYNRQIQSLLAGDFLVIDATGSFDPAAPPEWKAAQAYKAGQSPKLSRTASSVPEEKLQAIQACFVKPPVRYRLPFDELIANYKKAESLCRQAIAEHPDADDLWVVRNRRIVALMGLWKSTGDRKHYDAAVEEAKTAIEKGMPAGTDLIARFCLAREALRAEGADMTVVIDSFAKPGGEEPVSASTYAAASLLALEIADRKLHEHYRRASLDQHANNPALWTVTAFLLDRYHRYWMYHPPFTAGWTYGRRQGHFLAIGDPEDAHRTVKAELKTLEGETFKIPEDSDGKWTVISFVTTAAGNGYLQRYSAFVDGRAFDDVNRIEAVLDDNAEAARKALEEQKRPKTFPTMLVPGGLDNPIVNQLGILAENERPNLVLVRPDGSIAAALSGLTMSAQHGSVIQNVIEWHDERAVDEALARGDLDEAKRLAFAHAPVEQQPPPGAPRNWRPKKLTPPHLRARAKVYMAMKDWKAAYEDIQAAYLEVNSKAGWLSMRTEDLDETERLRDIVLAELEQDERPQ